MSNSSSEFPEENALNNHVKAGSYGEEIAAEFLHGKGYQIIARNFRCRMGEIDIIARNRDFVVFTEVKLRKNADFAEAREFVTVSKQRKIRATALFWLGSHPCSLQPRFDVIEIYSPQNQEDKPYVRLITDAFE